MASFNIANNGFLDNAKSVFPVMMLANSTGGIINALGGSGGNGSGNVIVSTFSDFLLQDSSNTFFVVRDTGSLFQFLTLGGATYSPVGNIFPVGNTSNVFVLGGLSNVTIQGGVSNVVLAGGQANVVLNGGQSNVVVTSGNLNTTILGGVVNTVVTSGNLNTTILGGTVNTVVTGGTSNVVVTGGQSNVNITGGGFDDNVLQDGANLVFFIQRDFGNGTFSNFLPNGSSYTPSSNVRFASQATANVAIVGITNVTVTAGTLNTIGSITSNVTVAAVNQILATVNTSVIGNVQVYSLPAAPLYVQSNSSLPLSVTQTTAANVNMVLNTVNVASNPAVPLYVQSNSSLPLSVTQTTAANVNNILNTVNVASNPAVPLYVQSNSTLPLIVSGQVTVAGNTATSVPVSSNVAVGTTDAGNPIKIGAVAYTGAGVQPPVVTTGQRQNLISDKQGKLATTGVLRNLKGVSTNVFTATTASRIIVPAGGSAGNNQFFCDIYGLIITNSDTTNTSILISDGTNIIPIFAAAGDTVGFSFPADSAIPASTNGVAWTANTQTPVSSVNITALYHMTL